MTLRSTIISLVTLLLVATVAAIGALGFFVTRTSLDVLNARYLTAVSQGAAKGVEALTSRAEPLLSSIDVPEDLTASFEDGEREFASRLLARMKANPDLTYLSYGDEGTGHYTAIKRDDDGTLLVNRSDPRANGGIEEYWKIADDGSFSPLPTDGNRPYDPRARDWYQLAKSAGKFVWTRPFDFFSGGRGIAANLPVTGRDGRFRGVLSLDISLERLSSYLAALRGGSGGDVFVLLGDGTHVAESTSDWNSASARALERIEGALPRSMEMLPAGQTLHATVGSDGYSVSFYPISQTGRLRWTIAVSVPDSEFRGVVTQVEEMTAVVGLLALVLAVFAGFVVAGRISKPLHVISDELQQVARLTLSQMPPPRSRITEIGVLGDSLVRMKVGLRSFSRYVPHDLVRGFLESGKEANLGGETRTLSLFFSDLAHFSTISETLSPQSVVENLSEYLEVMTETIREHLGTVSQYTGDGVFAFFNAPMPDDSHAYRAVSAALLIQKRLAERNRSRAAEGRFEFHNRIGLHRAEVVVGNIGTANKLAYTAIGDGVNLASRLEGLNKVYGTCIVASGAIETELRDSFLWRKLDRASVVGRKEALELFEPLAPIAEATDDQRRLRDRYEQGLALYLERRFADARRVFSELLTSWPSDGPAAEMTRRCEEFSKNPPPDQWDGVFVPHSK